MIREATGGGAHLTVDAIGSPGVVQQALETLRPRGRHLQLGLLPGGVQLDVSRLIGQELQWIGSHGMAAHSYPEMLQQVTSGRLRPAELVTRRITLDEAPAALQAMDTAASAGITVIRP